MECLNDFYYKYPEIGLRILWYEQINFGLLSKMPSLRNFDISSFLTSNYTPLLQNLELTDLGLEKPNQ